ncbi:hypothetical protein JXB01_00820 [Candidatus Micrarchaeota archaeon]|nr:hypothetical protein [Candidatus Micrarchaeota archaeon]
MLIETEAGSIGLDSRKGDISFISHAHSDHTSGLKSKQELISHPATVELAGLKGNLNSIKEVKLLEAGHMLGSKQLFMDTGEKTITYTGDIRVKDSIMFKGAEIPKTDELIMEATYGSPQYVFPPEETVYQQIGNWVKKNKNSILLIGGYEMGKAQEIVKVLNDYADTVPVVNERVDYLCSVYEKYGIKLERIKLGTDEAEEAMKGPFTAVVPPKYAKRTFAGKIQNAFGRKTLSAFVSGWTLYYRYNTDIGFPLSDHADYDDLKYYITESGAKKVKFFCGTGKYLKKELDLD